MIQKSCKFEALGFWLVLLLIGLVACNQVENKEAVIHYEQGMRFFSQSDWELAIDEFDKAIALNPQFVDATYYRGNAYWALSEFDQAITDYSKVIEIEPEFADAYARRASTYFLQRDENWIELSIKDYSMVINLNPTDASAYAHRGIMYKQSAQVELALADLDKAIELDKDDGRGFELAELYHIRSIFHQENGEYEKALADLERTIELDPEFGKVLEQDYQNLLDLVKESE